MNHSKRPLIRLSIALSAVAVVICNVPVSSAAPFQNLGFESAVLPSPIPYDRLVYATQALPGWTSNNYEPDTVCYDCCALSSVSVSIYDGLLSDFYINMRPLAGTYSVLLKDGIDPSNLYNNIGAYISQKGDIPSAAKSLMFKSDTPIYLDRLQVSLNDVVVPFTTYTTGDMVNSDNGFFGPVTTYICDIRAFSGQTDVTLKFEKLVQEPIEGGMVDLDDIAFSTIVVPEPSSLAPLAIGTLTLAIALRLRFRHSIGR